MQEWITLQKLMIYQGGNDEKTQKDWQKQKF